MEKTTQVGIRLPTATKAALLAAAADERRTMTSLIDKLVTDWLLANRYLTAPPKAAG